MKLEAWLGQKGHGGKKRTQDRLAMAVGVTQGRISQIAARGTRDLEIALLIQQATGNEVTVQDLVMDKPKPKRAPVKRRAA
jgi:predicted XRE-type DNA-binding protein